MQGLHARLSPHILSFLTSRARLETSEAGRIDALLLEAEDHMALKMWDGAAAALEKLPDDVRGLPYVEVVYLDLLIAQKLWDRGLAHGLGLIENNPKDPELWLRVARLMRGIGNRDGAHTAAEQCLALDPNYRSFLVADGLVG